MIFVTTEVKRNQGQQKVVATFLFCTKFQPTHQFPDACTAFWVISAMMVKASAVSTDEDDDEEEKARLDAIASVVIDSEQVLRNATEPSAKKRGRSTVADSVKGQLGASNGLKHYQIRGQDLLHALLDKTFGANFSDKTPVAAAAAREDPLGNEVDDDDDDIQLFRTAPRGFVLKDAAEAPSIGKRVERRRGSRKCLCVDEDNPKHQQRLQSVAVDGTSIIQQAERENARARAADEAAEVALHEARKREEDRVASLKRERGEEWLPSVARDLAHALPLKKKRKKKGKGVSQAQLPANPHAQ